MDKKVPLLIIIGILLLASFLIGIKFIFSAISKEQSEKRFLMEELEKREAVFSRMNRQFQDLSTEKSQLAQREAELVERLKLFEDDIRSKTEREAFLNKRAEGLAEEKQILARALSETNESMQKKLRMTAEEAKQELERRKKEYIAAERKSIVEITVLKKELESLNWEKNTLEEMILELADELNYARDSAAYAEEQKAPDIKLDDDYHSTLKELSAEELFRQHYNQGLSYDGIGEYKRALEEYQKALEFMPADPDLHYNMAIVYDDHVNNKKQAIFHYQRYIELNPRSPDRLKVEAWLGRAREDLKWQKKLN